MNDQAKSKDCSKIGGSVEEHSFAMSFPSQAAADLRSKEQARPEKHQKQLEKSFILEVFLNVNLLIVFIAGLIPTAWRALFKATDLPSLSRRLPGVR